jgi:succinate dehydrogenase / fumarate reductase, membrane anchor subunit
MRKADLTTMRSPINRVRGLGAAKSGTAHFWLQRVTAVANVPLVMGFVVVVVALLGRNQAAVVQILGSPIVAIAMLLFIVSVTWQRGSACRSSSRTTCITRAGASSR